MFSKKFDPEKIRKDFKCLNKNNGSKPIYFDNACMTLKPNSVVEAITEYYYEHPSCHNRANHEFGEITTNKVNKTRKLINKYINCRTDESIIFTKNTTESINIISNIIDFKEGDLILTTDMEHNSNMLPWQFLNIKKKVSFKQIPITPTDDEFNLNLFEEVLKNNKVKLVSLFYTSNITGMTLPIKEITRISHKYGAKVLLDAAQAMPHHKLDVQELDIDFMAFSIHKMFGPTGLGVLYSKFENVVNAIPPTIGGEGIVDTTYDSCTLDQTPYKFEVGLQNYAAIIGAHEAINFLKGINLDKGNEHIHSLNTYLSEYINSEKLFSILGSSNPKNRGSIVNISIAEKDSAEVGLILSKTSKIMVRSGVHCGHSWYHKYNLQPSLRVSFSYYNTISEVDTLINSLKKFL